MWEKHNPRGLRGGRDHICLEGGSGKEKGGILPWARKFRRGINSQRQGGRCILVRGNSVNNGKEAGKLRSVQGAQNSAIRLKHQHGGLGLGAEAEMCRTLGQGNSHGDFGLGQRGPVPVRTGKRKQMLAQPWTYRKGDSGRMGGKEWRKKEESKVTGILTYRTGRMVGTNFSKLCRA